MAKRKQQVKGADGKPPDEDFLRSVGGRPLHKIMGLSADAGEVWDFGWIPPYMRSDLQHAAHAQAEANMPKFYTPHRKGAKQALLYEVWKDPVVIEANKRPFSGIYQKTGSCVGAGGGTMWMTLAGIEAARQGDPEIPKVPFWLLPYGRSRLYCGMRTPGEGSQGSCFAEAAVKDGTLPYDHQGLPQPSEDDGMLTWGAGVERSWSDGDAKQTMDLLATSRNYLIKTAAKASGHVDVMAGLFNGFSATVASMYAHDGGKVQSDPPVLLGKRRGSWSHQMSIVAVWEHPKLGPIFYLMNQWGASAHGTCPSGAPPGGVWITASDVDWICRDEGYVFSQFNGFPAPSFDIPGVF